MSNGICQKLGSDCLENVVLWLMHTSVQNQIITAPFGATLVTAGAGSGKTKVLTDRIIHLLDNGISDKAIVALTFTNKAAKEMKARVEKSRGQSIQTFLGTFHSFCARILRKNIHHLAGYTSDFSIYDTDSSFKVIKEILAETKLEWLDPKTGTKIVEFHLGNMKNKGLCLDSYRKLIEHRDDCDDILSVIGLYQKKLKSCNALDFDDLLLKTLELFEKSPDTLQTLQHQFDYILVDEFQDTNATQYEIVRRLAFGKKNIMVVGDEDQCIYTWRGASIENLNRFINDFAPRVFKLEQNFRSGKPIVDLANKLIGNNTNRLCKVLFSEIESGNVVFKQYYDDKDEARRIVETILARQTRNESLNDFAILMRINALSRSFEEQLNLYNVPYVVWGGFKFYERSEVKIALSYLKVLVNSLDNVATEDALGFPKRGVGEASIEKIAKHATETGQTMLQAMTCPKLGLPAKAISGIGEFRSVIDKLTEIHNEHGLEGIAAEFLDITKLARAYKTGKEEDERRIDNLYELMGAVKQFAKDNPEANLSQYLQSVSLNVGEGEESNDRVVISTIHSAKGLEFKHVFVVGVEDGIFPLERCKSSLSEMEEERRLLYVAITRAKQTLQLSYATSRYHRGNRTQQVPSKFLGECGWENFSYENVSIRKVDQFKPSKAVSSDFEIGDRVSHLTFGQGTVEDIIDKTILRIKFDTAGIKMMSTSFAKLEKIY